LQTDNLSVDIYKNYHNLVILTKFQKYGLQVLKY